MKFKVGDILFDVDKNCINDRGNIYKVEDITTKSDEHVYRLKVLFSSTKDAYDLNQSLLWSTATIDNCCILATKATKVLYGL